MDIEKRVILHARYIIETGATVRKTASHYKISKSTVHKDVSERLKYIDKVLFNEVKEVFAVNLCERHIRGGKATKLKYRAVKQ